MTDDSLRRALEFIETHHQRTLSGYREMVSDGITIDPWGVQGGTYDNPIVIRGGYWYGGVAEAWEDQPNDNIFLLYRDGTGRPWIEKYDAQYYYREAVEYFTTDQFDNPGQYGIPGHSPANMGADPTYAGDSYTGLGWRHPWEGEEPVGRVESHLEEPPPLEETTPFGPQESLEPDYDPWDIRSREGHWDPAKLQWVYDEPTSSVGKVLDDDTPWAKPPGEDEPTSSVGKVLDDDSTHTLGKRKLGTDEDSSAADHAANLDDVAGPLRSGHWDPAALRWVNDEPTTTVEGIPPDDISTHTLGKRKVPTTEEDTQVPVEGGAGGGVDPGSPAPEGEGDDVAGMGGPYQDYIPYVPMVQDPATGEWRNAEPGEIPGVGEGEGDQLPPVTQTPESEPPVQPTPGDDGGGGIPGVGVPYQDYIPFYPMVQDPTTSEWRNAEPGEIPGPEGSEPDAPGSPQMLSDLFDASAPGPTLDADLFNPNAPGPTLDPRLLLDSDSSGPTLDPALLDASAPGPTLDPALLDPHSPGATIDPSLLDPSAPGETIDAALLDPSAPGPTVDPAQLEQGIVEPTGGGVAEPTDVVAGQIFTDPGLTEPVHPEPSMPGYDLHDPSALG